MDLKISYASARASLMSDEDNQFFCAGLEGGSCPQAGDQFERFSLCWKSAASSGLFECFSDVQ